MSHPYSEGLRQLADALDKLAQKDVVPTVCGEGSDLEIGFYSLGNEDETSKIIAKSLRTFGKEYNDSFFSIRKTYGHVIAKFVFYRASVCKKVVVGTEDVPEEVIEAREARIIPAHTRDVTKWVCDEALLSADEKAA